MYKFKMFNNLFYFLATLKTDNKVIEDIVLRTDDIHSKYSLNTLPDEIGLLFLFFFIVVLSVNAKGIIDFLERMDDENKAKFFRLPIALRSFSGGLAAAYVLLLLIPEFTIINNELNNSIISSFSLALFGLLIFNGVHHYLFNRASKSNEKMGEWKFIEINVEEERTDFQINLVFFSIYASLILLTLPFQFHHLSNNLSRVFYLITFILHLGFDALSICEEDEQRFRKDSTIILLPLISLATVLAAFSVFPDSVLLSIFSLLGGIVIYNVFRIELKSTEKTDFTWFTLGSLFFAILNYFY